MKFKNVNFNNKYIKEKGKIVSNYQLTIINYKLTKN